MPRADATLEAFFDLFVDEAAMIPTEDEERERLPGGRSRVRPLADRLNRALRRDLDRVSTLALELDARLRYGEPADTRPVIPDDLAFGPPASRMPSRPDLRWLWHDIWSIPRAPGRGRSRGRRHPSTCARWIGHHRLRLSARLTYSLTLADGATLFEKYA